MRRLLLVLAFVTSAGAEMLPDLGGFNSNGNITGANVLQCATYVARKSGSYTKLAIRYTSGTGGSTIGAAIYNDVDTDASQLAEVSGASTSGTGGTVSATGLSFSLTAGTRYRVCVCDTSTTPTYVSIYDSAIASGHLPSMLNAGAFTTTVGTSDPAKPCVTGNPPAETGALVASTAFRLPAVTIE